MHVFYLRLGIFLLSVCVILIISCSVGTVMVAFTLTGSHHQDCFASECKIATSTCAGRGTCKDTTIMRYYLRKDNYSITVEQEEKVEFPCSILDETNVVVLTNSTPILGCYYNNASDFTMAMTFGLNGNAEIKIVGIVILGLAIILFVVLAIMSIVFIVYAFNTFDPLVTYILRRMAGEPDPS
ncbi:predicted protein [Naegleria gruberi]|uniref:Predicted protein n=1 Tax=Naegleria gruberi TaxID=5762 RepID=D2V908_NAEGR|nr:uncharacterized protein NAEGRDRAFT_65348 [Naegleria gruberi]EFC46894.1 predicted protein [Naegleria gruberi]|eukprot:XP_002679638.1 predicted protein [Naegleria gruberi strain NEG-M]